jgi:hypothetical protein
VCVQIFVMTLHSVSEGIGIGVSFGGKSGSQLGQFISLSLGEADRQAGWRDGGMEGWRDGGMDGWMDGWMDGL